MKIVRLIFYLLLLMNGCSSLHSGYYAPKYSFSKYYIGKCYLFFDVSNDRFSYYNGAEQTTRHATGTFAMAKDKVVLKSDTNIYSLPLMVQSAVSQKIQKDRVHFSIDKKCNFDCYQNWIFTLIINDTVKVNLTPAELDSFEYHGMVTSYYLDVKATWDFEGVNKHFSTEKIYNMPNNNILHLYVYIDNSLFGYETFIDDTLL